MDDTLISQNSWYKLNLAVGITDAEDMQMYTDFVNGSLTYEQWIKQLSKLYLNRGQATKEKITQTLSEFTLMEGAEATVKYLQEKSYQIAIISGSFDVLVEKVSQQLGVKLYKANTKIMFDETGYFKEFVSAGDEQHAKLSHLQQFCDELGISIDNCVCIGDGANDLELFKATGKGVTFPDALPEVQAAAWKVVQNLPAIKEVL